MMAEVETKPIAQPAAPIDLATDETPKRSIIYIGGLTKDVDADSISTQLARFGTVCNVRRPTSPDGSIHPFALVEMDISSKNVRKLKSTYSSAKWRGMLLTIGNGKPLYTERLRLEALQRKRRTRQRYRRWLAREKELLAVTDMEALAKLPPSQRAGWSIGRYQRAMPTLNMYNTRTRQFFTVEARTATTRIKRLISKNEKVQDGADDRMESIRSSQLSWHYDDAPYRPAVGTGGTLGQSLASGSLDEAAMIDQVNLKDERDMQLNVLQSLGGLGSAPGSDHTATASQSKAPVRDPNAWQAKRFDPDAEVDMTMDTGKDKHDKPDDSDDGDDSDHAVVEEPLADDDDEPLVSKDRFIQVKSNLSEVIKPASGDWRNTNAISTFSFFGGAQPEADTAAVDAPNVAVEPVKDAFQATMAVKPTTPAFRFFFTLDDLSLTGRLRPFQRQGTEEEVRKQWQDRREAVKADFKLKHRAALRRARKGHGAKRR